MTDGVIHPPYLGILQVTHSRCQVAIIGGGPGGLSAGIRLRELGTRRVIIIERETQAGGIPRHCGHSPFGLREFRRILSGANYAKRLVDQATKLGVELWLGSSVVKCEPEGLLTISRAQGMETLQAAKTIISSGNRETPRPARMVSGSRPQGIMTTGALQSMVYLKNQRPFKRPVIIGTELIAFSAVLTCRHAGIKPVAMIEENDRATFWKAAAVMPRMLGIPLHLNSSLRVIHGRHKVESVETENAGGDIQFLDCDGVIFTGQFVSESSLVRSSHLKLDPRSGGPAVDQYYRCSDPDYFACGNVLHPVDTAGWCWAEGRKVAEFVSADLNGLIKESRSHVEIDCHDDVIKYFTPQKIALGHDGTDQADLSDKQAVLQIRFNRQCKGQISLSDEHGLLSKKNVRAMPEQRQLLRLPLNGNIEKTRVLSLKFNHSQSIRDPLK